MMDMQVTGIKKDILQISTSDFSLYISGNTQNKKYNATNNNQNVSGHIKVDTRLSDLKKYTIRVLKLYGIWSLIYLPLIFIEMTKRGELNLIGFIHHTCLSCHHSHNIHLFFTDLAAINFIVKITDKLPKGSVLRNF